MPLHDLNAPNPLLSVEPLFCVYALSRLVSGDPSYSLIRADGCASVGAFARFHYRKRRGAATMKSEMRRLETNTTW